MTDTDKLIWNPHAVPDKPKHLEIQNLAIEMFPPELTDLRIEIQKHPALLVVLAAQAEKDVYIQLMEIATYCDILVLGDYTMEDMLGLCKKMTEELVKIRTIQVY